ncbi:MAG TPA: TolC family outer membrane protein [Noviherbaspirillum sp.]|jgi:outer membrane protein|uniref:TolC family outer membrane protein n=1 Tax=Noviherbaspirillum sp. TaxID=1926288 RepID=UPI002F94F8E1
MNTLPFRAGVLALLSVLAVAAQAETLADIYQLARENDPRYRAMRSEFEATEFATKEARSGLLPNVGLGYTRATVDQNITKSENAVFATGQAKYPTTEQTLTITQPIFKLGAWRRYNQAKATEKQAASAYAAAEQDLMMRTATAYLAVLAAQDALALAKGEQESIRRQLDLAQGKYSSGQATVVNLYDARARNALKESDVVAAENDLADKMQALREIIGRMPGNLSVLPATIPLIGPEPQDPEQWVGTSLNNNLLLQARQMAVEVARQEIGRQKAGYFPSLDFSYSRNVNDTGGSLFGGGSTVNTNQMMFRLTVPIYEGGATSALTGQAVKHHETAREDLERDRRQIERQARAAYLGVMSGMVRVNALNQSVTALESARKLKDEGYKAGLTTVLAVLDAERDLYAARRDAAQARYDYQLNVLRLKQAAGSLSEEDLLRLSRLMQ